MQQAMRREHERQRARHDAREAEIEAEIAALAAVDAKPAAPTPAAGLPSTQSEVAAAMAVARQGDGAPAAGFVARPPDVATRLMSWN